VLIYLFIIYIKKKFKFPIVRDIAVIIPLNYFTYNITTSLFINACLAKNFFLGTKGGLLKYGKTY